MASRKNQVLAFIRSYFGAHGIGPSISEMAAAASCSRSRVQEIIRKLEREQLVNRVPGKSRGIVPISGHEEAIRQLVAMGYVVNPAPSLPLLDLDDDGQLTIGDGVG